MRQTKPKATCPYCGKRVALTVAGKLHAHTRGDGQRCVRSGGRPN